MKSHVCIYGIMYDKKFLKLIKNENNQQIQWNKHCVRIYKICMI